MGGMTLLLSGRTNATESIYVGCRQSTENRTHARPLRLGIVYRIRPVELKVAISLLRLHPQETNRDHQRLPLISPIKAPFDLSPPLFDNFENTLEACWISLNRRGKD